MVQLGEPPARPSRFGRVNDDQDYSDEEFAGFEEAIAEERRRDGRRILALPDAELRRGKHPGLLDHLEGSLGDLGDSADDETKDDEAVREIARLFIHSLRADR